MTEVQFRKIVRRRERVSRRQRGHGAGPPTREARCAVARVPGGLLHLRGWTERFGALGIRLRAAHAPLVADHVPLVAPAGTAHELPEQQSAVVVQTAPCG
jgi:hypothetical protein